jgi:DNA-binding beta-propeller fold protein YncE
MTVETIITQAHSLEEAREQVQTQVPPGLGLLDERIELAGQVKRFRAAGSTVEAALAEAERTVPAEARITSRRQLLAPDMTEIMLEADDEAAACQRVQNRLRAAQVLESLLVVRPGKRGVLGLGKKVGLYQATILQQAVVEVIYQTPSRFAFDIGPQVSYRSAGIWGRFGMEVGRFYSPVDLALDAEGSVYITDNGIVVAERGQPPDHFSRVTRFDSDGNVTAHWGSHGEDEGEFLEAQGLVFDASGDLYICDGARGRVSKFDREGRFLAGWGSKGRGEGQFSGGTLHVAIGPDGSVYVCDRSSPRLLQFNSQGRCLAMWGSAGKGEGQLERPESIAVDSMGHIYVADGGNDRVQKFDAQGKFLLQWGGRGRSDGQFESPRGIAVDRLDCVYVCGADDRVQKFTTDGRFIAEWGKPGKKQGELNLPQAIAVDQANHVYLLEYNNRRVQKFV